MHVILAGGGTAGHIEPALATADALRRRDPNVGITCLGTQRGLETRLVPERGYDLALVPPVPLPRKVSMDLLRVPARERQAVRETKAILARTGAAVVAGFGGYVALPAYLAARSSGIPVVVHEANVRPGLANKLGARWAKYVAISFPGTPLRGAQLVGIPLRRSITTLDRAALRAEGRAFFHLEADRPTVLVFGGSQGALTLNRAFSGAVGALATAGVQVLHAHGPKQSVSIEQPAGSPPYVTVPYIDRMDLAYAAADLVVCRSGAMTCAEMSAIGLPAIYVPLPIGNGEQRLNAQPTVTAGGGLLVEDAACTAEWIAVNVPPLVTDPQRLEAMSAAATSLGHRSADEAMADLVLTAAGG